MAGRKTSTGRVLAGWRLIVVLLLVSCTIERSVAQPLQVYDIDLVAQSVADALNRLSEQTGAPVVFPYDLVKDRKSNPVVGRYTLQQAVEVLLKGTGLTGGLSEKGVLTVSLPRPDATERGETRVNQQPTEKKKAPAARLASVLGFFAALGAAFTASADEAADDGSNIISVVVTAQKKSERTLDVPVPVTVVEPQMLTASDQVNLREYFTIVPGFSVSPNIEGSQMLYIRGISSGGFTAPTVGVTIDDVPYGFTMGWGGGNSTPDIDPDDLKSIEILRGPQGTLYGSNSMGGLVKFVTADPSTERYSGRVEAGFNSVHNGAQPGFNFRASGNIPLTDTLAVRLSGFARQDAGYIDNPLLDRRGVNRSDTEGGRLSALWQPSSSLSLKLSALYQHTQDDGLAEINQPTPGFPETSGLGDLQQSYIAGVDHAHRTVQAYSANLKADLGGGVTLTSLTGYNSYQTLGPFDFSWAFGSEVTQPAFGVTGTWLGNYTNISKLSQELRFTGSLTSKLDWMVGGYFTREHSHFIEYVNAEDPNTAQVVGQELYFTSPSTYKEYAGFADLTWHVTDRFDIQVGGRESFDQTDNSTYAIGILAPVFASLPSPASYTAPTAKTNAFTYLFTPQLKLSSDLMIYARLASGFRPGGPNNPLSDVPAKFAPDKTNNYEIGLKGEFLDHALSVDTSVYYIDWKNMQIFSFTPSNFGYTANGSSAKSEGVEVSIAARLWEGFSLSAWGDYDNAVLTQDFPSTSQNYGVSGDRLPFVSRYSGNVSMEQDVSLSHTLTGFLGGTVSYVGDRTGVFQPTAQRQLYPSYTKTDLRAGVRGDTWAVNLYANNVTDSRGLLNGGLGYLPPFAFVIIQPRTVGLSVSKTF